MIRNAGTGPYRHARSLLRLPSAVFAVADLFLAVGMLGVYLKVALLGREWDAVARFLGKTTAADLTIGERIGFFWQDVALNIVAIPLVGTALVCLAFARHRVKAALAICVAMTATYFVELRAHAAVGQYISGDVLRDLIGWSVRNPEMGRDYASTASLIKLVLLFCSMLGIALVFRWSQRATHAGRTSHSRIGEALLRAPAIAALPLGVTIAVAGFTWRLPNAPLNESAVALALAALATGDEAGEAAVGTFADVLQATQRDSRTTALDAAHPFVGRERGSDVLMFIMETAPSRALDLSQEAAVLPGAASLLGRSFVAARHYTTHPYSSDALY